MAYTWTLDSLTQFVRYLTGIYSSDIVDNGSLNTKLNTEYFELEKRQTWTWTAGASGMSTGSSSPAFEPTYHLLLAYRVAAKLLIENGDTTTRIQEYTAVADTYEKELYQYDITRNIPGNNSQVLEASVSYADLVKEVRLLLGVFDTSLSSTFIQNKLVEEYTQLNANFNWPWKNESTWASNQLSLGWLDKAYQDKNYTDNQYVTKWSSFSNILVYGATARLAVLLGNEQVAKAAQTEYDFLLSRMRKELLTVQELPMSLNTGNPYIVSVKYLVDLSRQLTNDFSLDIPNSLLTEWVYEEIYNLSTERTWHHLRGTLGVTLPAGVSIITPPVADYKVLSIWQYKGEHPILELKPRPNTLGIEPNAYNYYYSHDITTSSILISPTPKEDISLVASIYVNQLLNLYASDGTRLNDLGYVNIHEQFRMLIPYRVALKAILYSPNKVNKDLVSVYNASAEKLHENMVNYYQNETNTETFTIGVEGTEQKKYIPYFKVN